MKFSSNCSKDLGNIKPNPNNDNDGKPQRHWFMTLNNYDKSDIELILNSDCSILTKFVFQEEIGEKGTPHLQGYFYWPAKMRPLSFFKFTNHPWWKKCRSIQASKDYCSKLNTRNGETYIRGIKFPKKHIIDIELYDWQHDIINMLDKEPDDRSIYWFFSEDGDKGKTTFQKWYHLKYKDKYDILCLDGSSSDMKNGIIQFMKNNENRTPEIIFMNIPKNKGNDISYTGLETIKDMWFYSGKYEGGMVNGPRPHLLVFANKPPNYDKMTNRFIAKELK